MTDPLPRILITKAPKDAVAKREWVNHLLRIQVALWLPASCEQCGVVYRDVDDFLSRNPHHGGTDAGRILFVDKSCWDDYRRRVGLR